MCRTSVRDVEMLLLYLDKQQKKYLHITSEPLSEHRPDDMWRVLHAEDAGWQAVTCGAPWSVVDFGIYLGLLKVSHKQEALASRLLLFAAVEATGQGLAWLTSQPQPQHVRIWEAVAACA